MCKFILSVVLVLIYAGTSANNVSLTNTSVVNNPTATGKVIQFDLSWENSWRTSSTNNYDGVWVFFKFKDLDGKWYPLRFNGSNITMPAGFARDMGSNAGATGVGIFIYRSANGFGTSTATAIRAGIESFPGTFEIRGFAIEMVYIPAGAFYLGDGYSGSAYQNGSTGNNPYQVTNVGSSITPGSSVGNLYDPLTGSLNSFANYPVAFNAYWMMKYELSQGGYRDFLNTLTYTQQSNRVSNSPNGGIGSNTNPIGGAYRQYIEIVTPGVSSTTPAVYGCDASADNVCNGPADGEWVAVSLLNYADAAAYLDWAGLRPMSEFEYEKACRGPLVPVAGEYAWGTNGIASHTYNLADAFMNSEAISNPSAVFGNAINTNAGYSNYTRGGIFATAISTRISAGAGYYGVLDLSGNAIESVVTSGNIAGRSYTGRHGDGYLTSVGNANENYWPGVNGATGTAVSAGIYDGFDGVRSDGGEAYKGGHIISPTSNLLVSHRFITGAGSATLISRSFIYGIRGVRDAN